MTIETVVMAAWVTLVITMLRIGRQRVGQVWTAAAWWEKALLLLFFAPIPGPVDEIVGAIVVARILRRISRIGTVAVLDARLDALEQQAAE